MSEAFIPPYPRPHRSKLGMVMRFYRGWNSWIHTLMEKSYTMKMGEVKLPGVDFFIPNEPELVARVMNDPWEFPKHRLLRDILYPLLGNSLLSINGEGWVSQRAMVNPAFAHTNLRKAFATMEQAVLAVLERIEKYDLSKPVLIDPLITHVTGDIIFRTIFSRELSEADALQIFAGFERYQKDVQPTMILRIYGFPIGRRKRKLNEVAQEIHHVFEHVVRERYDAFHAGKGTDDDILHSLLEAKHPKTGEHFTYQELLDQVSIIFFAGHETTASAISWALYLIASCPHVQKQLQEEIAAVGTIDVESVKQLAATKNVFRETLRLYPPISFLMREVEKETTMRDKKMKKGSLLVISPWLIQRNKNNFPCPHAFKPERFEDASQAEACKEAYLPFGRGPRVCIGAGFAQQEAVLVLAHIVRKFSLSVPDGMVPEPVSRLTLRSKHGIRLMFGARGGAN